MTSNNTYYTHYCISLNKFCIIFSPHKPKDNTYWVSLKNDDEIKISYFENNETEYNFCHTIKDDVITIDEYLAMQRDNKINQII